MQRCSSEGSHYYNPCKAAELLQNFTKALNCVSKLPETLSISCTTKLFAALWLFGQKANLTKCTSLFRKLFNSAAPKPNCQTLLILKIIIKMMTSTRWRGLLGLLGLLGWLGWSGWRGWPGRVLMIMTVGCIWEGVRGEGAGSAWRAAGSRTGSPAPYIWALRYINFEISISYIIYWYITRY